MTATIPKDFALAFPRPVKTYHRTTYERLTSTVSAFEGDGKTVLITGGATGIGLAITKSFAVAGVSRICIVSRSPGPQAEAKKTLAREFPNVKVDVFSASLSDLAATDKVVKEVGKIDILVLSAVYGPEQVPLNQQAVDDMQSAYSTNVIGNWNLVKSVLAGRTGNRCDIINVSSFAAYIPLPGQGAYGPNKAAFAMIMSAFANEYNESEVRFVSFHPGAIWTPMASRHFKKESFEGWEDADLPGNFAVWLASPEAAFLHGRFVWAQWDVDELIALKSTIESNPMYLKLSLVQ